MENSVKILVISDTHGNYPLAIKAADQAGSVEIIIHLGDGLDDAKVVEDVTAVPVVKIAGNCDFSTSVPEELTMTVGGKKLFITHGHKYRVKSGLQKLHSKALLEQVPIVLYGHTHIAAIDSLDEMLFVNPGCLAQNCTDKSCAVITIAGSKISADILPMD